MIIGIHDIQEKRCVAFITKMTKQEVWVVTMFPIKRSVSLYRAGTFAFDAALQSLP